MSMKEETKCDTEETSSVVSDSVQISSKKRFCWISLLSENGTSASIGRIAFWFGLVVALYYWI